MKRLNGKDYQILFDFQRFRDDPGLKALIDETARRRLAGDGDFFILSDEMLGAVYGAGDERKPSLCPYCGAVLRDEETLRQHLSDKHRIN